MSSPASPRVLRDKAPRAVLLTARGTSDHAALYAKYLLEIGLGLPCGLTSTSTLTVYEATPDLRDVLWISISQSGGSPDLVESTAAARRAGAITLAVTNNPASPLAQAAEHHLDVHAGPELAVAATKSYTAQLLTLWLLVTTWRGGDLAPAKALPGFLEQAVSATDVPDVAARYRFVDRLVVTARGYSYPTAREAALKLMETSYLSAQAFSAADLMHGPLAMVDADRPVIAVVPQGRGGEAMAPVLDALRDRGARRLRRRPRGPGARRDRPPRLPAGCPRNSPRRADRSAAAARARDGRRARAGPGRSARAAQGHRDPMTVLARGTVHTGSRVLPEGWALLDGREVVAVGTGPAPDADQTVEGAHVVPGSSTCTATAAGRQLRRSRGRGRRGRPHRRRDPPRARDDDARREPRHRPARRTRRHRGRPRRPRDRRGARRCPPRGAVAEPGPPRRPRPRVAARARPADLDRFLRTGARADGDHRARTAGGLAAVQQITAAGAIASIGHTGADADTTRRAVDAGARWATHLFNAMPPVHHREPGAVPALLDDDRVTVELIADGVHLHPLVVALAARRAGRGRVALVTDAMAATGSADGRYRWATSTSTWSTGWPGSPTAGRSPAAP